MSDKVSKAYQIMNYPGLPAVTGADMAKAFEKQLAMMEIDITDSRIGTVYAMGDYFAIQAGGEVLEAKSVILACGVVSGKTLPGEEEMLGRGVSYCATCDACFYKGKKVAVIAYITSARDSISAFVYTPCFSKISTASVNTLKSPNSLIAVSVVSAGIAYTMDLMFGSPLLSASANHSSAYPSPLNMIL